ncbi:DUF2793 domain-containing protein [Blastomonas sp. AAP53]|uniref:DUF2793 domain-containing protein n=1 Tax=Blastomonas sp. AAP53 TaxID=1248760 RepID=UPI0002D97502|nr:DUF2793 domain-containing protein [Blastomonas sp. AAP53]
MSSTPNIALPLLYAAQAQKEITHNEALLLIDALLPGSVVARANDPSALSPQPGDAWIIGPAPLGAWAGHSAKIGVFSEGGWRFAPAVPGMRLFDRAAGAVCQYDGSGWVAAPAIADPSGGETIDAEARATLAGMLAALRSAGLLAVT